MSEEETFRRAGPTKWRKNSWHRYYMKKLRHCHPMYTFWPVEWSSKLPRKLHDSADNGMESISGKFQLYDFSFLTYEPCAGQAHKGTDDLRCRIAYISTIYCMSWRDSTMLVMQCTRTDAIRHFAADDVFREVGRHPRT